MKKLRICAMLSAGCAASIMAQSGQIVIGSFDSTRSRAPFATDSGPPGLRYSHIRSALTDPVNFGPDGAVKHSVVIAPGTPAITAAYLEGKSVFFSSVFTGALSNSEAAAISAFVARGGCILVDADSCQLQLDGTCSDAEQQAANSLISALGKAASSGAAEDCPNAVGGGLITSDADALTDGPFGKLTEGSWATTRSALVTLGGSTSLVTCSGTNPVRSFYPRTATSGLVMVGGDPSAFDLYTDPDLFGFSLFNANNEKMYLNAVAACLPPVLININIDIKPGSSPSPINTRSRGKIPVAILSSATFSAPARVRTSSLRFGATGNEPSLAFCNSSSEDVNLDGLPDLVCHFTTQLTGFTSASAVGILKGETIDGLPILGQDSVRIVH